MSIKERMPARKLVISLVALMVVFALCIAYTISGVLDTPLTSRPKNVRVELTSTGGLFEGSVVTYRGVKVGKVTDIHFTDQGVEAIARITSGDKIPADSQAVVRYLSPVGEQYVDFRPSSTKGPYLEDGSRIKASHTDVPRTLGSTVISINKLLEQVDPDKVKIALEESSNALRGTSDDLARLTDQGALLINDINRLWPTTQRVLTNGGTLLDIGVDNAARITQTVRDLKAVMAFLKEFDPQLRAALERGPGQVRTLRALLKDAEETLPTFLSLGSDVLELLAAYEPHLRANFAAFGPGLAVLATSVKNGRLQLNAIGQRDHQCAYGTTKLDPKTTTQRPLVTDKQCESGFAWQGRGSRTAPGPVR